MNLQIPVVANENVPLGVVVLASTDEAHPRVHEPVSFLVSGFLLESESAGGPKDGAWAGPFMLRFERSEMTGGYDLVMRVLEPEADRG